MAKNNLDVLAEWVRRGYLTHTESMARKEKHLSYIDQAKESILNYCNIPVRANMPDGLFYAWVEIGWAAETAETGQSGTDAVKAITEGDTTVTFATGDVATASLSGAMQAHKAVLNQYRRLF